MAPERLIICGNVGNPRPPRKNQPLELELHTRKRNVRLLLDEVRRSLWKPIPAPIRDLLDLAAYVTTADQATTRADGGRPNDPEIGAGWRRRFQFQVAFREPDLWNSKPVRDALESTLGFQSEDEYHFEFVRLRRDPALQGYLRYDETPFDGEIAEVVPFSGGLDSLAGAITEARDKRRQILLVNHRTNPKLVERHNTLVRQLQTALSELAPVHFPVLVNKSKCLGQEHTQRTRSFLFVALGTLFARMIWLNHMRFYENGVTSLNLPPSAQVVGARASRTTHPRVLAGFQCLVKAVLDQPFTIDNPFQWDTKTDVVRRIAAADCAPLIGLSMSCSHTMHLNSRYHTHCGACSQCIDRRFAVLAAGQQSHDPTGQYGVELLLGPRAAGEQRLMVAGYLELVHRVAGMGQRCFLTQFGEVARALPFLGLPLDAAASRVFTLYQSHARQVDGVVGHEIAAHINALRRREYDPTCLLRLAYDPAAETPVAAEANRPDGNYFHKRGEGWVVRYGSGKENIYLPDVGFEYLQILLGCPGTSFSAAQLAAHVNRPRETHAQPPEGTTKSTGFGADDILDPEARIAYRVRLRELDEAIQEAEHSSSPARLEAIEELSLERDRLHAELVKSKSHVGKPRKLDNERNRVRDRVGRAISRALLKIAEHDPPLAEHLAKPTLRIGSQPCYNPTPAVSWDVDS